MPLTESTIQTLDSLNRIVESYNKGQENEKDRALVMMRLKVQSDERELDRLNTQLARRQEMADKTNAEFAKIVGAERAIAKESKGYTSDARSVLGRKISTSAENADRLTSEIDQLNQSIREKQGVIGLYHQTIKNMPELYQTFKDVDKNQKEEYKLQSKALLSEMERQNITIKLGQAMGIDFYDDEVTDREQAALNAMRDALPALEQNELENLIKLKGLAQKDETLYLEKMKIAAEAEAARIKALGKGLGDATKSLVNEYATWRDAYNNKTKSQGREGDDALYAPHVPTSATELGTAKNTIAENVGRFFADKLDNDLFWLTLPSDVKSLKGKFRDASTTEDRIRIGKEIISKLKEKGDTREFFDDDDADYLDDQMYGYHLLNRMNFSGEDVNPKTVAKEIEEITGIGQKGKGTKAEEGVDTGSTGRGFMETITDPALRRQFIRNTYKSISEAEIPDIPLIGAVNEAGQSLREAMFPDYNQENKPWLGEFLYNKSGESIDDIDAAMTALSEFASRNVHKGPSPPGSGTTFWGTMDDYTTHPGDSTVYADYQKELNQISQEDGIRRLIYDLVNDKKKRKRGKK